MYNKKVIIDAIKNLNKAKTFPKYNNAYTNNKPNKKNSNNITSEQGVNTPVFKSVHAAPSKIHGKGLFTQEPISKGDTIGVSHIRKKFMKNNEEYQAPFPSKQLGYYNHSESPNVYEVDNGDHIIMKAKRNINPGEELTANYYNANIKDLENPDNFKKGGATNRPKLPNKKNSKAYSRSFEATNRLFAQNPLFSKPKSRKNKIFDPNAKYYANGGALSKFLDGGPQCPEGYTYNPETKRCTRKNTNCPEGYFFDAQEGRCKSKVYREKFELYNKGTKITPTEEEESYSYWPDDLTLKDLDEYIMLSPEGSEVDRPFLISPIKEIGIYNPEKGEYEEDIDDRYLADAYVKVYPDLNYQVVVDPSKPKGYNADKSIYYVPDENNFEFEKFKQYKKLKEIEKENLLNLAKYPNLITKEWQEDYKEVSPGFIEAKLTPEEIEEYAKGGYIIEDISVPTLTRMQDGGLPKAFEGRPVKITEKVKEKEKEKESEKINAVNTNIQNLGTDYRPNVTAEKTSFNLGNFIKPLYDISKIKTDISKALAKSSITQFLNATHPMEMALIKDLKNEGLISETLPEEILITYPNLLDLATRRGIQKANTVFRGTRPFIGNSNILRSSENTQTALPLEYFNYLKSLPSDVARAAYMSSHISPINVGARVGLDHVIGMNTPMDALYYSRQNVDNPSIEYTYGPLQTELRFPFDFSEGNASTWLQKYREMPFRWKKQEDGSIEKNREYEPGVIHNEDIFAGGEPGHEGAILGLRNQRVLEPVRVRYNETFRNLEDQEGLNNYLYEIMSKRSPEEQSDYITHFNNEILPQLDVPKDYLKDRGFRNFGPAESLYDVHSYLYYHNRYLKDIAKKPSNIQVIPYSPFSFKFKEGGQFELGDEVELTKEQLKKLQEEGYTFEIVK